MRRSIVRVASYRALASRPNRFESIRPLTLGLDAGKKVFMEIFALRLIAQKSEQKSVFAFIVDGLRAA
jgi:hypothetical protein